MYQQNQFRSLFNIINKEGKDKNIFSIVYRYGLRFAKCHESTLYEYYNGIAKKISFKKFNVKSTMTNYSYFVSIIISSIVIHQSMPRYLLVELPTKERGKDFNYITLNVGERF